MGIGICAIAVPRGPKRLLFKSGVNSHSEIKKSFGISEDQEQVNLEAYFQNDSSFFNINSWKVVHSLIGLPTWFKKDQKEIEGLFLSFVEEELKSSKEIYKGDLDLSNLSSAKGLVLPKTITGSLFLNNLVSAEGLVLPKNIGGFLDLSSLRSAEGLVLPENIGGYLDLSNLRSAKSLVLPKRIGKDLYLSSLVSAKVLVLPKTITGSLYLDSLTSVKGLVLPKIIGGSLDLSSLVSAKDLVLPEKIGGHLNLGKFTIDDVLLENTKTEDLPLLIPKMKTKEGMEKLARLIKDS